MSQFDWRIDVEEFHQEILYPTVLVRSSKGGGSGTVIYSKPHPDGEGFYTLVLTNYHVIEDALSFKTDFDPVVGRDIKRDTRESVVVGDYEYRHLSKQTSVRSTQADIVFYDKARDLALLELRTRREFPWVAALFPERDQHLYIGQPVVAVGCSLGHKPLPSFGVISSLDEDMQGQKRILSSAQIIYGNSGGALYTMGSRELIGVPCGGDVILSGFSSTPIPHLGYAIPYYLIYDFLREGSFEFIFDSTKSIEDCERERNSKRDALQAAWEERWRREKEMG